MQGESERSPYHLPNFSLSLSLPYSIPDSSSCTAYRPFDALRQLSSLNLCPTFMVGSSLTPCHFCRTGGGPSPPGHPHFKQVLHSCTPASSLQSGWHRTTVDVLRALLRSGSHSAACTPCQRTFTTAAARATGAAAAGPLPSHEQAPMVSGRDGASHMRHTQSHSSCHTAHQRQVVWSRHQALSSRPDACLGAGHWHW